MKEAEEFLKDIKLSKSENTFLTYQVSIRKFVEFLKEKNLRLKDVKPSHIREFRNSLAEKFQPSTVNNRLSAIREFFEFLLERGDVESNPVSHRLYLKQKKRLPKPLTIQELKTVLNACERSDYRLCLFSMASLGTRVSETVNLKKGDFIFNRYLKVKVLGKGNKERITISCFEAYDKEIKEYLDKLEGERVFPFSVSAIKKYCITLSKKTGIKVSCHRLRHTYATILVKEGMDIIRVKELLGHSDVSTTAIYTEISLSDIEKRMVRIRNQYIKPKLTIQRVRLK